MKFLRKINLEINKDLYNPIQVKQNDTARYLLFNLLDNGVPFSLENKTVRVYGVKPDGTKIFNNLTIVDAENGLAELQLTSQMLVKPGCLKLELVIYEATDILSTTKFDIDIISCIRDDASIESTNEFSALTLGLSKLDEWDKYFEETSGKIEEKYTERLSGLASQLEESKTQLSNLTQNIEEQEQKIHELESNGISQDTVKKTTEKYLEDNIDLTSMSQTAIDLITQGQTEIKVEVESGGILTSNGENDSAIVNNRIRTNGYITLINDRKIIIDSDEGYEYLLSFYDTNNEYIGSTAWLSKHQEFTNISSLNIRIQFKRTGELPISSVDLTHYKIIQKNFQVSNYKIDKNLFTKGTIVNGMFKGHSNRIVSKIINNPICFTLNNKNLVYYIEEYDNGEWIKSHLPYKPLTLYNLISTSFPFRIVIKKNNELNFTDDEIVNINNNCVNNEKTTNKMKIGLFDINGNISNYAYSCTSDLIEIKKGTLIKLKEYNNYFITIREKINNKYTTHEILNGYFLADKDFYGAINIVRGQNGVSEKDFNVTGLIDYLEQYQLVIDNIPILNNENIPHGVYLSSLKAKKIYDYKFKPLKNIPGPIGDFVPTKEYNGIPYSSARVTDTFVGTNILIETFFSALKNPNSVLYTENLSQPPYSQPNASTFYGMVCSVYVAYCLGLKIRPTTENWGNIDGMKKIPKNIENLEIGDSLLYVDDVGTDGHVMIVTNVVKEKGKVKYVEYYESTHPTIKKNFEDSVTFKAVTLKKYDIYRYTKINENINDVDNFDFSAEEYLNIDYGNKSNYRIGKPVKVSIFNQEYTHILVYKNNNLIDSIAIDTQIKQLNELGEGDYKICLSKGAIEVEITPFIYFKIVNDNTTLIKDGDRYKITLDSNSGNPTWFSWNDSTHVVMKCREITGDEKCNGYLFDNYKTGNWKVKVYYENDYGVFSSNPIDVDIL